MRPGLDRCLSRTDLVPFHHPVQIPAVGKRGEDFEYFLRKHREHQESNTYISPEYQEGNNYEDGDNPARDFTDKHYPARVQSINYGPGGHIKQYAWRNGRK